MLIRLFWCFSHSKGGVASFYIKICIGDVSFLLIKFSEGGVASVFISLGKGVMASLLINFPKGAWPLFY